MEKELVSIITPMYNSGNYIKETIESVLSQTYQNWEMIVIDDGSKDNGPDIVRSYVLNDSRISLFSQANAGSAAARNNGIRRARGQYIALLDADDLWSPNFLESQIALMNEKQALVVHSSYRRINEKSMEILSPYQARPIVTYKDMQMTNHIACLTGLYDCSKYGKIYLREELKSIRDDYAYWIDAVKLAGVAYGNPKVLASYRVMSTSTTGKKKKLIKAQFNFYYKYQKLGLLRSLYYTLYWGVMGILKFSR